MERNKIINTFIYEINNVLSIGTKEYQRCYHLFYLLYGNVCKGKFLCHISSDSTYHSVTLSV